MGNNIESYRASIGCFNNRSGRHKNTVTWGNNQGTPSILGMLVLLIATFENIAFTMLISLYILSISSDIHPNPGPNYRNSTNNARITDRVSFCNFNIRSIGTKERFDHIVENVGGRYDIITITETWLKEGTPDTKFNLENYCKPFRLDRPEGKAGGVMCYVKTNMSSKNRPDLRVNSLELLWVEITVKNQKLLVGTCYRQQGAKNPGEFWDALQESYTKAIQTGIKNIILTGDFNSDKGTNLPAYKLMDFFIKTNKLHQHVTKPTRVVEKTKSILDLLLTSDKYLIYNTDVISSVHDNDHGTVTAILNFRIPKP
jgi:hypothetical protein